MKTTDNGNTLITTSPFSNWACAHSFFDAVLQWLLQRIFGLSEPALLLVVGPTGVGKSTLIHQLIANLAYRLTGELQANPSRLHKVYAEAQFVPGRGLDWDDLFTSMLTDAGEILVGRKTAPDGPPKRPGRAGLAAAAQEMLRWRTPAACIIDEGGAFVESDSAESLARVLDFLKTFGNRSKTHIVIFGDYRMAKMVEFSGQLNRRCHVMHFPNYTKELRNGFDQVVHTFESRLVSLGIAANLTAESDLVFDGSCGCIGLLKRWTENAWLAVRETNQPIDRTVLESTRFPAGSLVRWRTEIEHGHAKMKLFFDGCPKSHQPGQP